ncbi:MAG TPA: hypothetical protein VGQ41_09850 [Pyrinomonadaceae bacterium]|nr:hypothetical protein [Pyrinomonadaceae bacterium]
MNNSTARWSQTGVSQQTTRTARARNLSLQPLAFNMAGRLGQRFSKRAQSIVTATLNAGADQRVIDITRKQTDNGEQVEIKTVGLEGLLTWHAGTGALSSGARAGGSERELIERLVLDSPDQFVCSSRRPQRIARLWEWRWSAAAVHPQRTGC